MAILCFFWGLGLHSPGFLAVVESQGGGELKEHLKAHLGTFPPGPPLDPTLSQVAMYYEEQAQRKNLLNIKRVSLRLFVFNSE